jgi:hypothetical protein
VIYSGNGAPTLSLGKNGDYYLDKSNGNLYGPKTANGWGSPLALTAGQGAAGAQGPAGPSGPQGPSGSQGSQGAQGNPGSQTYSGNGAPATTLGIIGDYYLDKTNFLLYGPKTAAGWGTPILLRGAQGPQGPAGPAGVPGSQIFAGTGAPAATLGNIGDYYLDKSTGNFYGPKTANGWGSPIALSGGSGSQGPAGPQGPSGPQGPAGATGATGATGAAGAAGSKIYSGSGAPPAGTGTIGDYYIDDTHAILYGPKTGSTWPATGLSLQVNNTITYNFVNKVQLNLPYKWVVPVSSNYSGTADQILLPFNNAAAQTTGFTIPQSIVDNGIVLAYIRYFNGPPNDTATDAGMSAWHQIPFSTNYFINGVSLPINLNTGMDDNGFYIYLNSAQAFQGNTYATASYPAVIRIVLIPDGQINTIQNYDPNLKTGMPMHSIF